MRCGDNRYVTESVRMSSTESSPCSPRRPIAHSTPMPNRSPPPQPQSNMSGCVTCGGIPIGPGEKLVEEHVIITSTNVGMKCRPRPSPSPRPIRRRSPCGARPIRRDTPCRCAKSTPKSGSMYSSFDQLSISEIDKTGTRKGLPPKYQSQEVCPSTYGSTARGDSSSISSKMFTPQKKKKPPESILQWFDRSCERELSRRQMEPYGNLDVSNIRGLERPEMVDASVSGIDMEGLLRTEQNTELYEACEKLAKAQAMDNFTGAVKAAERAAANAPPEYAEEAAAAGARGYQAELTSIVQEKTAGFHPMEVIGYVGVTKPKHAAPPRKCEMNQTRHTFG